MNFSKKLFLGSLLVLFCVPVIVWACGQLDSTKPVPTGFGASYDLILPGYSSLIKVNCANPNTQVSVGNGSTVQYIYKKGYFYRNNAWQEFTFDNAVAGNDWIIGTANLSLTLSDAEKAGTNYIVAYVCTWTGAQWKCGCRDKACANNFWQLQSFKYSGATCADADGDGYDNCAVGASGGDSKALDCDDAKSAVHPGVLEVCDATDNDCNGQTDEGCDSDSDTYCDSGMKLYGGNTMCKGTAFKGEGTVGSDCDDTNANINPSIAEICDGVDNDCDKNTDEGCTCTDFDKDGYDTCVTGELGDDGKAEDCNDKSWDRNPGAYEVCDGVDNDCDNSVDEGGVCCVDTDSDGYDTCAVGSEGDDEKVIDCDDNNSYKNPGATETCDNIDNNCNGKIDEACDEDGDDYCSNKMKVYNIPVSVCPKTSVVSGANGNDCNDVDYNLNPGVTEKCDGVDNDCDGQVDEGCTCTNGQTQACGIDTGACQAGSQTCTNGAWGACAGEIKAIAEVCGDKIDNDCDSSIDEGCSSCLDGDADGYDNCAIGASGDDGKAIDCNDNERWSNPGGVENCDSVDNNCNGQTDEGCDDDRDGYCDGGMLIYGSNAMCKMTAYNVAGMSGDDCNDQDINIHPGKAEICGNGLDENCTGGSDDGCGVTSNMSLEFSYPNIEKYAKGYSVFFVYKAIGGSMPIRYTIQSNLDGTIYQGYNDYYDTSTLSLGKHQITVSASDAGGKTVSANKNVEIVSDTDFVFPISGPETGRQFFTGSTVYFSVNNMTSFSPTYTWTSDRDGVLGTGSYLSISSLSVGTHKITMNAVQGVRTYAESVQIEVVTKPFLEVWPAVSSVDQGVKLYISPMFSGKSTTVTYSISSDIDGFLTSAFLIDTSRMTLGVHTITITATGDASETATATMKLEVIKSVCYDSDGDGYGTSNSAACQYSGIDCDDGNVNVNPGIQEDCNTIADDDCDSYTNDCKINVNVLLPAKDDVTLERGTKTTIRVDAQGASYINADIQSPDGTWMNSFRLYDDGAHNDLLANDGIWANTWTVSGASTDRYYLDLQVQKTGVPGTEAYNNVRTFYLSSPPVCETVVNNGSSDDKLDILLVPDQFTEAEMTTMATKAKKISDYFFAIEPYKTYKNRINFSWVHVAQDLGCDTGADCSYASAVGSAASCPWDKIVFFADKSFRSKAIPGLYALVSATDVDYDWVVVHEFGHAFGSLKDEYLEDGIYVSAAEINNSVNCDTSSTCTKWSGVAGAGCFAGCAYTSAYYRSIDKGIMGVRRTTSYGPVNVNWLTNLLQSYK